MRRLHHQLQLRALPVDRQRDTVIQDDFDQVDIDAPIPYRLTAKGRRDLQMAIAEEQFLNCEHDWKVDLTRGLVCRRCGVETMPRKLESIPSHLGPRERR